MFWGLYLGFFGLFLLAVGIVLGLSARRNQQSASHLQRPLHRIARLEPGVRKTRGKIVALGKSLQSPVTKKECVYYRLRIYEEKKRYKRDLNFLEAFLPRCSLYGPLGDVFDETLEEPLHEERAIYSRHLLLEEVHNVPLVIEDDTDSVEVDLDGATVITKEKNQFSSGDDRPPPSGLDDLLREECNFSVVDQRGFFKRLYFVEEVLPLGAKVTVVGPVESLKSGDLCFQSNNGLLLVGERDVAKEGQSARNRALGFTIGAAATLGMGLGCLLGAFFLMTQTRRTRK